MRHNLRQRTSYLFLGFALSGVISLSTAHANIKLAVGNPPSKTRIAVEVKPSSLEGWSYRLIENGVEIILEGNVPPISVGAFNKNKAAQRVSSAQTYRDTNRTRLRFNFNCACTARAFTYQGKKILVDITNVAPSTLQMPEAAARPTKFEKPEATQTPQSTTPESKVSAQPVAPKKSSLVADIERQILEQFEKAKAQGILSSRTSTQDKSIEIQEAEEETPQSAAPPKTETSKPEESFRRFVGEEEFKDAIFEETTKEGRRKLLPLVTPPADPALTTDPSEPVVQPPLSNNPEENTQAPRTAIPSQPEPSAQVENIDGIDTANIETGPEKTLPPEAYPKHLRRNTPRPERVGRQLTKESIEQSNLPPGTCIPNDQFDAVNWEQGSSFLSGLREVRSGLVNARDIPIAQAVETAMRHYIAYNLPEEARHLAEVFDMTHPRIKHLIELANILEDKPSAVQTNIARATDCEDDHLMWKAMALWNANPQEALKNFEKVSSSIGSLPRRLRVVALERMAQAALSTGDTLRANSYLNLATRISGKPSLTAQLLRAHIFVAEGDFEAGKEVFRRIRHMRNPAAVEAVISLAKLESPISEQTLNYLADTALLYRGKSIGLTALKYRARGLAKQDRLAEAMNEVTHESIMRPESSADILEIQRQLLQDAMTNDKIIPSASTLEAILANLWVLPADRTTDKNRSHFANYLIEEGLYGIADKLLDSSLVARNKQARHLKAKIALLENKPDAALQLLDDDTGNTVDALRQKASILQEDSLAIVPPKINRPSVVQDIPEGLQTPIQRPDPAGAPSLKDTRSLTDDTARDIELLKDLLTNG